MTGKQQKLLGIILTILVLTGVGAAIGNPPKANNLDVVDTLHKTLDKSGITWEGYTVTGWARVPESMSSAKGIARLKEQIELAVKPLRPRTEISIQIKQINCNNNQSSEGTHETYVTVSLSGIEQHQGKHAFLARALKGLGLEPQVLTVVRGSVPGRLTPKEQGTLLQKAFSGVEAHRTEGIDTDELVSITGFSPLFPDQLELATGKININAAARYSSVRGKTLIFVGTPLIPTEY